MELRRWVILVCLSQCLLATPGAAKKKLEIITEVERATIIYMLVHESITMSCLSYFNIFAV